MYRGIKTIPRRLLGKFLTDHESIHTFEKLLENAGVLIPSAVDESFTVATTADAKAQLAIGLLTSIEQSLALLASAPPVIPSSGIHGLPGIGGRPGLDGEDGEDGLFVYVNPAAVGLIGPQGYTIRGEDGEDGSDLYYLISQPGQILESGVYTPSLTNVANLDASTAYQCQYLRVGSVVTVSGKVAVDPTLAAASTQLGISLPIASNIGDAEDCAGVAFASGIAAQGAAIIGDAANNRAQLQFISADLTNQAMYITFQHRII